MAGREVLERSVAAFVAHPQVRQVVVALPAELAAAPPHYLESGVKPIVVVAGGARRQDSVANAFAAVDPAAEVVLVHDAARPFVTPAIIDRTIEAARDAGAALAAVRARDTVKQANAQGDVDRTIARESIYLAQTPQGFRRAVLEEALAIAARDSVEATDEAALVERAGHAVRLVAGEASNMKITTPEDLAIAETIALRSANASAERRGSAKASAERAGTGYDLHRLVAGRRLVLGGISIPSDRGALGHSDADVVCHAITDALLGAVSLGDIGRHFPDSDRRWKGASSLDLLARAAAIVAEHGFEAANIDVTVVLEAPKIRDYVDAMRAAVANAVGITADLVSIKGKTNEGVDAIGRGEAIAAHAVALLRRK